jgi:hypothetical protein
MWSFDWRSISAVLALGLLISDLLAAQTPVPVPSASLSQAEAGLESPDAARAIVAGVLKQDEQLRPILNAIDPKQWYESKGAPATYVIQWQTEQSELSQLDLAARLFSQKIDDLPAALDLYFRLESIETTARAITEGAQRYADRAAADQLASFVTHNFDSRQRFRDYLRELANSVEQNFKIADEEAQRCRGAQSQAPAPCPATRKRG